MPLCGRVIPETCLGVRKFDTDTDTGVLLAGKASTVYLEHKGDITFLFAILMKLSDN